jgi:hypothetical protein
MAHSQAILSGKLRWNNGVLEQEWVGRGGGGEYEWRSVPSVNGPRVCTCAIGGFCKDHEQQCEYPPERKSVSHGQQQK